MKALIAVVTLTLLVGCSSVQPAGGSRMLRYPERSLADWSPDLAIAEADRDFESGKQKIYLSGTIVALAPGVDSADFELVKPLPKADAGIGCVISDEAFRSAQFNYASRYNARDVERMKKRPNQALQPTRMLVTFRADARPAPSTRVADL